MAAHTAVVSYCGSAAASMMFARAFKGGVVLRRSVKLPALSSVAVAVRPMRRCYSQGARAMSSQWRPEASGGFEGHEVEVDSNNEFPRPSSVAWSKEMANTVHLIGNVGRDMEIKYLDTGKVVAKSSLAVNRNSLKKDDPPSWYGVIVHV
jgi:hypothetical protein